MNDTLTEICIAKRKHVAERKAAVHENHLLDQIRRGDKPRPFKRALETKLRQDKLALIAEIKKASPSKGVIREDFDVVALAKAYEAGGAACLSVLTDEPYFQGHDSYLALAREATSLPVLRKDFILDPYQVVESRALGADCILLIMAALEDAEARELEAAAFNMGMHVLVEVHNRKELDRALAHLKPALIGINNRDLKTLTVDLATSEKLAKHIPKPILPVCESGIFTHDDLLRMRKAGIACFLVGESLMRERDVTQATKKLLGH